jgi:hypothetical protein
VTDLPLRAQQVLEDAWDEARGYCYPNPTTYPHLWLWDSCFHSIAWAQIGDPRGVTELEAVMEGQYSNGFVPHMRYAAPTISRGPHAEASSFTQPPVYAHAARVLADHGLRVGEGLLSRIGRALDYLWNYRMSPHGLLYIVHPWEAGTDDSPRWDDWVGSTEWERDRWTESDLALLAAAEFDESGLATSSKHFEVAPASFNILAAHAAREFAALGGSQEWADRASTLSAEIDRQLWDSDQNLWSDLSLVGGNDSGRTPTLDGVLGALTTSDEAKAMAAMNQLTDRTRFDAPFGLAFVARSHHTYRPDRYWRGSAWMQMNYLAWLAAHRWGRVDLTDHIAALSRRGAMESQFAEHWNAEKGEALGAVPQTWSALVTAML